MVLRHEHRTAVGGVNGVRVVGIRPPIGNEREVRVGNERPLGIGDGDVRHGDDGGRQVGPGRAAVERLHEPRVAHEHAGRVDLVEHHRGIRAEGAQHGRPGQPAVDRLPDEVVGRELVLDGVHDERVGRVDRHRTAAVAIHAGPDHGVGKLRDPIGLGPADGGVRLRGVGGDAVDLRDREIAVQIGPGVIGLEPPDAAIGADEEPAGTVARERVNAGVRAVAVDIGRDIGPGRPAVGRLENRLGTGRG